LIGLPLAADLERKSALFELDPIFLFHDPHRFDVIDLIA
jgi:hypothetical protein